MKLDYTIDLFISVYNPSGSIESIEKSQIDRACTRISNFFSKAFFNKYDNDVIEYAYILHENDVNEKGEVEQAHYHICMRKTNKTNRKLLL